MLLADTNIDTKLREALRTLNVRYVEQLPAIVSDARKLFMLSEALGIEKPLLQTEFKKLLEIYPDHVLPASQDTTIRRAGIRIRP